MTTVIVPPINPFGAIPFDVVTPPFADLAGTGLALTFAATALVLGTLILSSRRSRGAQPAAAEVRVERVFEHAA